MTQAQAERYPRNMDGGDCHRTRSLRRSDIVIEIRTDRQLDHGKSNVRKSTERALEALARSFSAADIMTPEAALARADSVAEATLLLGDYDLVPFPKNGSVTGYFTHGVTDPCDLRPAIVISDSTTVLDLPEFFLAQPSLLVLRGQRIVGLVHFSDLNNPIVKLPLYVMFEAVESELVPELNRRATQADLEAVLRPERLRAIRARLAEARQHRADMGLAQGLLFSELLSLGMRVGILTITAADRDLLIGTRNRIAHADTPLVRNVEDVSALARAKEAFEDLGSMLEALPSAG